MPKTTTPPTAEEVAAEQAQLEDDYAARIGIVVEDLAALLLLDTVKGFGPQKFKELHEAGLRPSEVLADPSRVPMTGKTGEKFRAALAGVDDQAREIAHARAVRQLVRAQQHDARVVTYLDELYPANVYESNNPIPVLYVRGNPEVLRHRRTVAMVGSRETAPPYSTRHEELASHAVRARFAISSGFARGADTIGHLAARDAGGRTMLVMPCGLDRPFPPESRDLWTELLTYDGAVMVSEFSFGTSASTLTLRKRNKLIVAFSLGVLLSQSSAKGGAMNAYRFAEEQGKPVATFTSDGQERTSGNRHIAQQAGQTTLDGTGSSATVFPADRAAPEAWDAWLDELSSST